MLPTFEGLSPNTWNSPSLSLPRLRQMFFLPVGLGVTPSTQGMRPNSIIGVLRLPTHYRKIQETYICDGFSWGCNTLAAQDMTAELGLATAKWSEVYRLQTTGVASPRQNVTAKCSGPRMVRSPSGWINSTWESMNVNAVGTLPLWHCFGMPQVYPTTCPWKSLNREKRCGVKWLQKDFLTTVPQPCGSCFLILYSSIKNCCTLFFSTALPMKTKMMLLMHSHATIHCSTPHCFGFCFFQQKSTLQKPCSIMSVA